MDPGAPYTIATGGLVTSAAGGAYGAIYSVFHNMPWMSLAGKSAVNSGIVGWAFFGIREALVSPLLVSSLPWREYQRRRIQIGLKPLAGDDFSLEQTEAIQRIGITTWRDIRTSYLLDTFLAGGITGGILNSIRRGPSVLAPSFITSGLICCIAQYSFNELSVQRLKYLSRAEVRSHSAKESLSLRERYERWSDSANSYWKEFLPRKLSDEEYAEKMAAREKALKERQAAKERNAQKATPQAS